MDFRAQDWSGCSASHAGLAFRGLGLEFLSRSDKKLFQWLSKWAYSLRFPEDVLNQVHSVMGDWIFRIFYTNFNDLASSF